MTSSDYSSSYIKWQNCIPLLCWPVWQEEALPHQNTGVWEVLEAVWACLFLSLLLRLCFGEHFCFLTSHEGAILPRLYLAWFLFCIPHFPISFVVLFCGSILNLNGVCELDLVWADTTQSARLPFTLCLYLVTDSQEALMRHSGVGECSLRWGPQFRWEMMQAEAEVGVPGYPDFTGKLEESRMGPAGWRWTNNLWEI